MQVAYKAVGLAVTDVIGGRVQMMFPNASTEVIASSPEELAATMKSEMARMGKVIKAAGIRVD